MKLGTFQRAAMLIAGSCAAVAVAAPQTRTRAPQRAGAGMPAPAAPGAKPSNAQPTGAKPANGPAANAPTSPAGPTATGLNLPANPQFLGDNSPIRKATAIVNGAVITATDVDQRVALILIANGGQIPADQIPAVREQVLRALVDETLQIQAAEQEKIKVTDAELNQYFARYAQSFKQTPQQFAAFLRANGSSATSVKRQIWGEMAWSRLQGNRIEPFVNVSEDEVKQVMNRLNAAKGTQEFRVAEIFLSATPETAANVRANADRIVAQLRGGSAAFQAYARQFSEASTAAVGGELGWVRAEQLPEALSAAVRGLPVGEVSNPVAIPGGFSILLVEDTRQVLTADPRDAVLSLKQLSLVFAQGTPRETVEGKARELAQAAQTMGGCGGAEAAAARLGAEVVANDQVKVRDLPGPLQSTVLTLGVGQATTPFGTPERVSVLVLCGRDDPPAQGELTYDQVSRQLTEARVSMRARRYLRDLRRDAVIDYR